MAALSRSSPSIRDRLFSLGLITAAALTGGIAWSGNPLTLPLAFAFPALWAWSPSRIVATFVAASYFLAASRGLPQGVANFYGSDLWPGLLLWIAASLSFVVLHGALWTKRPGTGKTLRYALASLVMAVPPFAVVGWAHPLTAAGVLFPEWGWLGLAAAAAGLLAMATRRWPAAAIALGGFWLWSAASWTVPSVPRKWKGVNLELGQSLGRNGALQQQRDLIATVRRAAGEGARIVVLPESALGFWTSTVEQLWRDDLGELDVTMIAGAADVDLRGYDNVMVAISAGHAEVLYRERMPVPVSMWQPWRAWFGESGGARAHMFANSVVHIRGQRVAPLICYEQLLVWPFLQSMLHSPDIIVATGNAWWTAGTSIVAIQKANSTAWARLFGVPLVTAFNM